MFDVILLCVHICTCISYTRSISSPSFFVSLSSFYTCTRFCVLPLASLPRRCYFDRNGNSMTIVGKIVAAIQRHGFDEWIDARKQNIDRHGMSRKLCLTYSDCRIRIKNDMNESKSPISKKITAFGIYTGFCTIISMVGTIVCFLLQYFVFNEIILQQGTPFPIFLEGTCTCMGEICPDVLFTFSPSKERIAASFGNINTFTSSKRSASSYANTNTSIHYTFDDEPAIDEDRSTEAVNTKFRNNNHMEDYFDAWDATNFIQHHMHVSTLKQAEARVIRDRQYTKMGETQDKMDLNAAERQEQKNIAVKDCFCDILNGDLNDGSWYTGGNRCGQVPCRGNLPKVLLLVPPKFGFARRDLSDTHCWTTSPEASAAPTINVLSTSNAEEVFWDDMCPEEYCYLAQNKRPCYDEENDPPTRDCNDPKCCNEFSNIDRLTARRNVLGQNGQQHSSDDLFPAALPLVAYSTVLGLFLLFQEILNLSPGGHKCARLMVKDRVCIGGVALFLRNTCSPISIFFGEVFYYLTFVAGFNVCLAMFLSPGPDLTGYSDDIVNDPNYKG